jgi:hypothetical protein
MDSFLIKQSLRLQFNPNFRDHEVCSFCSTFINEQVDRCVTVTINSYIYFNSVSLQHKID